MAYAMKKLANMSSNPAGEDTASDVVLSRPDHGPVTDGLAMLRRMGSSVVHLAAVDPLWFDVTKWVGPPYWGLHQPAAALCGAVLKPDHRGLVAMQPGSKVTCRPCQRRRPEWRM